MSRVSEKRESVIEGNFPSALINEKSVGDSYHEYEQIFFFYNKEINGIFIWDRETLVKYRETRP